MREKPRAEAYIADTNGKLDHAWRVQQQAQAALAKAKWLNDTAARGISRRAQAMATETIQTNQQSLEEAEK